MNRDVGCVPTTGLMIFVFLFTAIAPVNAGREVRLILQITVDGLRGDLLSRYGDRFGLDGFRYLLEDGTVSTNAHSNMPIPKRLSVSRRLRRGLPLRCMG